MNYKGGVGKTTVTSNIAAELAHQGKKVLLIDLDPQANLTLSFVSFEEWRNLDQQKRTIKDWYDEFLDHNTNAPLRNCIITPYQVNNRLHSFFNQEGKIDLICSHLELIHVDMELSSRLGGPTDRAIRGNYLRVLSLLKRNLDSLREEHDVILIDCPPNFNIVTQNAMVASDYYIVPAKADYLSTLGIHTLIRHIHILKDKYNHHLRQGDANQLTEISPEMLGVVFTMISTNGKKPITIQQEYMRQVRNDFHIFTSYLRENKTLYADAPESGIPVVLKKVTRQQEDVIKEIQNLAIEVQQLANL
ncbi:ParA family protein [Robertmurraya sp. P23]|uniref:ParA family protein n=1 Tax=Robertmurraya sp. P23 TaxID=3436931 RepID=UPI003D986C90